MNKGGKWFVFESNGLYSNRMVCIRIEYNNSALTTCTRYEAINATVSFAHFRNVFGVQRNKELMKFSEP